ncbi:hypothetical protein TNCV_127121 [Trichonephila clavipes]|nr:hypothetical protein TNCV_127121 [Trichonephila clavipes]
MAARCEACRPKHGGHSPYYVDFARYRPPNRDICSCTSVSNSHVYNDGHSSFWPSWIVVPLSLRLKFEDYLTLGIPLR